MEGRKTIITICVIAGVLGLTSAVMGFAAEATRIKASQVHRQHDTCSYPRSPAYGLGLGAAFAILAAQALIHVAGDRICCGQTTCSINSHWTISIICLVTSCSTFLAAFIILLWGALLNDEHGPENFYYCQAVSPGFFAGGVVLCLVSTTFGILYYLSLLGGNPTVFVQGDNE